MRRDARWKIVHYLGQDCSELCDLPQDAGELRKLWPSAEYSGLKEQLQAQILTWSLCAHGRAGQKLTGCPRLLCLLTSWHMGLHPRIHDATQS